jgi:hypothetical protein
MLGMTLMTSTQPMEFKELALISNLLNLMNESGEKRAALAE